MPAGYTYASYQAAVVTQIPSFINDANFVTMLPNSIDYAELNIYRDLDFLATHGSISLTATIGNPVMALPTAVIVAEELYYGPNNTPLCPLSQAAIRAIYAGYGNGPPEYFAVVGAASGAGWAPAEQVLLGPAPDQAYALSAYVTERQATLSGTNTTTFISTQLPDLFWAAAMIFWSGYIKAFGSMSDNPQMAVSWEQEYQRILKGSQVEEARKKFAGPGGQAKFPVPPPN